MFTYGVVIVSRELVKKIAKKYASTNPVSLPLDLGDDYKIGCSIIGCNEIKDISSHWNPDFKETINLCAKHFYMLYLIMRDSN